VPGEFKRRESVSIRNETRGSVMSQSIKERDGEQTNSQLEEKGPTQVDDDDEQGNKSQKGGGQDR
jgi:hypothetical protein